MNVPDIFSSDLSPTLCINDLPPPHTHHIRSPREPPASPPAQMATRPLSCWTHPGCEDGLFSVPRCHNLQASKILNGPCKGVFVIDFRLCQDLNPPPCQDLINGSCNKPQGRVSSSTAKRMIWQRYDLKTHHTVVLLYPENASPCLGKHDVLELASATSDEPLVVSTFSAKAQVVSPSRVLVISRLSIQEFFVNDIRLAKARMLFQEIVHDFRHIAESKMGRRRKVKARLNMSLLFAAAAASQIARSRKAAPIGSSCGGVGPFFMSPEASWWHGEGQGEEEEEGSWEAAAVAASFGFVPLPDHA